jgi:hypothetical protein
VHEEFNYFSEIEERFCQRRATVVMLSTLDWALIETWKDAGIPLEAVLRGIDAAFDRYDARPSKTRKVNSLAYCAQEVLAAAEDIQEAALGATHEVKAQADSGFEPVQIAAYLERNAEALTALVGAATGGKTCSLPPSAETLVRDSARTLRDLASGLKEAKGNPLEDLERRLTVMEEKLFAALLAVTPDEQIVEVRAEADRELAPYRRKMTGPQIEQLQKQYLHKRLWERYGIPRLSLFYM